MNIPDLMVLTKHANQTTNNKTNLKFVVVAAKGHFGHECRRSQGKTCDKCGKTGHFSQVCRSNPTNQNQGNKSAQKPPPKHNNRRDHFAKPLLNQIQRMAKKNTYFK